MEFFNKYKKIFFIIGFIFLIVLFGYLLYVMFFKPAPVVPPVEEEPVVEPGTLPVALPGEGPTIVITPGAGLPIQPEEEFVAEASDKAVGGVTKTTAINDAPALGVTLDKTGSNLLYYNKEDGTFYKISASGEEIKLSDKVFYNVEKITWASDSERAILEYPDGSNIVYDFSSEKQVTLPKHWEDFEFSPAGDKIALKSIGTDPSNRWLAVSNNDGTGIRGIEPLGEYADTVHVSWAPNNQTIAMYIKGVDFDRQEMFFVGLNGENFKSTILPGRGLEFQWNPAGEKLLYSVYTSDNGMKPSLWVVDAQGENIGANRKSLNVETWADKCAFADDNNIYCAVPESLPEGSGIFKELADTTKDNLYQINTLTGTRKLVAVPDDSYNMSAVIVSDDGRYLYFTDNVNSRIHKIELK